MTRRTAPALLAVALACGGEPTPLPTRAAVAEVERAPPVAGLARALYDAPVLPEPTASERRVRLLYWLRHMELTRGQLDRLDALRVLALGQAARVRQAELSTQARFQPDAEAVYDELFTALARGVALDDPELIPLVDRLGALGAGGERERTLLQLRMEGVRLVLEAERELLDTLSEAQEQRLAGAVFLLRRRLDPVGAPGDWEALVGSTYDPGAPGILLRGSSAAARDPLDPGGLWGQPAGVDEALLPEARREALLFLAVLEPGLEQAIAAARPLASP